MTKKICILVSVLFLTGLVSCLDMEEKIVINKNSSGTYTMTLDMSKMIKLMKEMDQQNKEETELPEKKDSTVYLKSFVDTSTALTAKEKEMFREGSVRMRIDEESNEFIVSFYFPFKDISTLPELKSSYMAAIDKLGISKKLTPAESGLDEDKPVDMENNKNILSPSSEAFAFAAVPGKISNTLVNKELFNNGIQNDSSLQMIQQMSMMMGDMNYKTVIVLPKKVKEYKGNQTILSDDKKTVSFLTTLSDMLNRPEAAEYMVEY
ncbi:MAG TPA: hypothetical protein VFV68_13005 [Agriterribacter sp.]|nr:hypothetical protein [Agriterribacter sp.]